MNVAPGKDVLNSRDINPRTRMLLQAPIFRVLLGLAWPNLLVMLAQASVGLIETWWVSRLGTSALTGMAVVFPGFMMVQMLSAGAIGGGIASAIARLLGAGRTEDANAVTTQAIALSVGFGVVTTAVFLIVGPTLYRTMGADDASLSAALTYSNIVFGGNIVVWISAAATSIIRGTGNMLVPSLAVCVGVVLLVPLSPLLIFGYGIIPPLGVAGAGIAVIVSTTITAIIAIGHVSSSYSIVRFVALHARWDLIADISRVAAVGVFNIFQTTLTIGLSTVLVAAAGGADAVAGYGTGARLEYLLVPIAFGFGSPLVALVGTNVGAGQHQRALRAAFIGGAIVFLLTELVGLAAAIWPVAWLSLFGASPQLLETGSQYLRVVGPTYGFLGLALSLYFASQGAGRLLWPFIGGVARLLIAVGCGLVALWISGSLIWLFVAQGVALVAYGGIIAVAVGSGVWFRPSSTRGSTQDVLSTGQSR